MVMLHWSIVRESRHAVFTIELVSLDGARKPAWHRDHARVIRHRTPRVVACRATGGHKSGYTLLKIAQFAAVSALRS